MQRKNMTIFEQFPKFKISSTMNIVVQTEKTNWNKINDDF